MLILFEQILFLHTRKIFYYLIDENSPEDGEVAEVKDPFWSKYAFTPHLTQHRNNVKLKKRFFIDGCSTLI